jgi:hypothetical protein
MRCGLSNVTAALAWRNDSQRASCEISSCRGGALSSSARRLGRAFARHALKPTAMVVDAETNFLGARSRTIHECQKLNGGKVIRGDYLHLLRDNSRAPVQRNSLLFRHSTRNASLHLASPNMISTTSPAVHDTGDAPQDLFCTKWPPVGRRLCPKLTT